MSYQVLARKWRPQVFDDVVGQGHITRTLQNAITAGRLAHAFLFSGPRGVGKTTTARILAKALNCAEGPTPTPCGKCDSCLETAAGTSVDVIEIDGASHRGIEHIRELRETVKYAPVGGKHKVYVIDEVHMLTNEAFNALLKTLEEPPPRVIFIFATTEPQKIPATIHSRCQRYGFKRVALHEITGRLRLIADAEGITITEQGLGMIARAAEGSMRDSLSLLDQAVSYGGMEIRDEDIRTTLGSVAQEELSKFALLLMARDAAGLLAQVDTLLERGQDMRQFLAGAVEHLRNLLVVKIAAAPASIIELPASDIEAIKQQAEGAPAEHLLLLFDSLSKTLDDLRWSPHQRFTLEVGLIKACSLAPLKPLSELLAQVKNLEARLAGTVRISAAPAAGIHESRVSYTAAAPKSDPAFSQAEPAPAVGDHGDLWDRILTGLKTKKPGIYSALSHSSIIRLSDDELVIGVSGNSFQVKKAEEPESRAVLEQIAEEILNRKVRLKMQQVEGGAQSPSPTKAPEKKKPGDQDPLVQDALRIFGGEIVEKDSAEN